jgi:hypothetical protein
MRKGIVTTLLLLFVIFFKIPVKAQGSSASDFLIAQPITDRVVYFSVSDMGVHKPIIFGLDLAWLDGNNVRRGIEFMGKERVKIIRSSFMPTDPLVGDTALQGEALIGINKRLDIIANYMGPGTNIMLNNDNPTVHADFYQNPVNWTKLMKITSQYHERRGFNVVSVAPFNEPDNIGAGQGTVQDFVNINTEVKKDPYFNGKRLSGPNMLNNDVFFNWYNPMKSQVDEGNTHQLAGSFDNYALIFKTLRADGKYATNDEMHNVMEAMVGVEYGLQSGIWWGTAELARGEFCKASDGVRLGYAEHRPNWTAASVYRHPDGRVQAFGGASERQSVTTTYRYVSKDRDVYYDGYGPQREFVLELPGGLPNTYGTPLHCGPERVINVTWGEDIQPVIDGRYKLVNRKSGRVMESISGNIQQNYYLGTKVQQWDVTPIDSRIGGDFSYFKIANVNDGLSPDVLGFSLENGANIIPYTLMTVNQQWYLEYAEDGWFYIRSKHSNKCIEVANSSTSPGANIQQWEKNGGTNQQWRFLPVSAPIEFIAPSAPTQLTATNQSSSVRLDWMASPETDVAGYNIYRSDSSGGPYSTIARNVTSNSFVDNKISANTPCYYVVKAVDKSMNRSNYSNEVLANSTGNNDLIMNLKFEENTLDSTVHLNHSAKLGDISFIEGINGGKAISLNGTNSFLQLSPTIANHTEITIATWIYWKGGSYSQRIFDFGNNANENMFLSPGLITGKMRFTIRKNEVEQSINVTKLPTGKWSHVAVTLGSNGARIYVNGELAGESVAITLSPLDIKPVLNYIGRSQTNPLLNGYIDDFRIYNYELSGEKIAQLALANPLNTKIVSYNEELNDVAFWPVPANKDLYLSIKTNERTAVSIYNINGELMFSQIINNNITKVDVSNLSPGVYLLKLASNNGYSMKKITIKH